MGDVGILVWLAAGYGIFLLAVAHGIDALARRTATRTTAWRSGAFTYHADHDAWLCPEDQWLWPQSFDPGNRVMRYRGSPAVCNACPVKATCTASEHGREISRNVDPWPSSEAERFHRAVACTVVVLGAMWPAAMMIGGRSGPELLVLGAAVVVIAAGSWPLWSHLHRSPAGFPDDVPVATLDETVAAREAVSARETRRRTGYRSDRRTAGPVPVQLRTRRPDGPMAPERADRDAFTTRWGAFETAPDGEVPGGWSRRGKR
ncbi:hypothetical protein [Georgenia yuyongxinii]|uniref:hypothetical protein n=1 Tax=Georgenia yuyongxinii TaxID=2589797 RepID=UPI001C8F672A|nr:hypothetical protein [Georgenia yuyongxinii]